MSDRLRAIGKKILRMSLALFTFALIFIISCVMLIPVLLLPLVTAVPKHIWIAADIATAAAIILPLRYRTRNRPVFLVLVGLLVVMMASVAASQYFAATPPILDANDKPVQGSIATMEQVTLNGTKQWITIRGKDRTKPVLLYLGIGGPGAGGFPATATSLKPLEDHFVVVNWDQPGTGKSYAARPIPSLKPQLFTDDAKALTELLLQRFHQKKIYVLGLSWGTIVGINLIQQYPQLYYAYIGNGQMVNTVENDRFGYNLAIKLMDDAGNIQMADKLRSYGEPPYIGNGMAMKYVDYNNVLFDYMESPNIWLILTLVPQLSKEYGYLDKINFDRGLIESFQVLYPQLKEMDFTVQAPRLETPVYFLVGEKDVNAVASIVERYYNGLAAPYKELIWSKSGHGATSEELVDALVNHVLATSPAGE